MGWRLGTAKPPGCPRSRALSPTPNPRPAPPSHPSRTLGHQGVKVGAPRQASVPHFHKADVFFLCCWGFRWAVAGPGGVGR